LRGKAGWYLERLRVMEPAEVLHRLFEFGRQRTYRYRPPSPAASKGARRGVRTPVLLPSIERLGELPGVERFWRERSAELAGGHVVLLGCSWPAAPLPDWRLDPVSGGRWPDSYTFDIDYRHGSADLGEVKCVWELNLLMYLVPVAAQARMQGDLDLATKVHDHVQDWLDRNRPYRGVAWSSGIEVALRLVALVAISELLEPQAQVVGVYAAVLEHADYLRRFPSRYSSANNHRVAELLGLIVANLVVDSEWLNTDELLRELIVVVESLFHEDGIGAEQSNTYAAFTLEMAATAAAAARASGSTCPVSLTGAMERALAALDALTDCRGHVVRFGDDDEGRVLSAAVPHEMHMDAVRLLVRGTAVRHRPSSPVMSFHAGGYTAVRTEDFGQEVLWVLDHGLLGHGALAAHGHADTLAVWCHIGGHPLFVDAGTYLYHSGGAWREYMRSTAAHNTVVLGGDSSSQPAGHFNWLRDARATGRRTALTAVPSMCVTAEHDGYVRSLGIVHQRRLERIDEGQFRLTDGVLGTNSVAARWSLLVHPAFDTRRTAEGWELSGPDEIRVRVRVPRSWDARTLRGSSNPRAGWYSERFGSVEPAAQLVLDGHMSPGETLDVDVILVANGV
jgi:hypothetical protein